MGYYPHLNDIFIADNLKLQLNGISGHPITTVIAPMGFGKTTAINWWVERKKKRNSIIVLRQMILADSISDFWNGFCKALKKFPELTEQLKILGYPKDEWALLMLAEFLDDTFSKIDSPFYLIIDDLHILNEPTLSAMLIFLTRSLPDRVHIILLSRNQVFSERDRMLLGNHLHEIGVNDLRLDRQNIAAYANQCGLAIPDDELNTLTNLSEGWISIIYLNFKFYVCNEKWLANSLDILSLIDEVLLEPLPDRQREFLILLGMTDEFTYELAVYLWQGEDTARLLDSFTKNNAFITKNENNIYRYHYILRECVRQKLSERSKDYRQKSYQRLGQWYLEHDEFILAYAAFAKAVDWDGLLNVLEKDKAKSLNSEHKQDFSGWLKECPEEILIRHPSALTTCMVKNFSFHNISEIKRLKNLLLKSLEQDVLLSGQERDNLLGDAEVSESFLCYNDISAMSAYHKRACGLLNRPSYSIDSKGSWTFTAPSVLMMYHRVVGQADQENTEMRECMPYYYKVSDGHGSGAEHIFEAELLYERGLLYDSDIANRIALSEAVQKNQFSIMLCCNFLSMRSALLNGDFSRINQIMADSRECLLKERQYGLLGTLDMCQGFVYALLCCPQLAPGWFLKGRLSETTVMFPATPMLQTFYNQLLLALGEWTQIIARRKECENLYGVYNNILCGIWLHIQLAAAFGRIEKRPEALEELKLALDMALPDGIIMPFVENEYYITDFLKDLQSKEVYKEKISKILVLAGRIRDQRVKIYCEHFADNVACGLTRREYEIAKLAAQRKTNSEIAEELHLANGTVRNQLTKIFDKLKITGDTKNKRLELESILKIQK